MAKVTMCDLCKGTIEVTEANKPLFYSEYGTVGSKSRYVNLCIQSDRDFCNACRLQALKGLTEDIKRWLKS